MNNVLFVNKPSGITSFDVCYRLRKVLNTKKIGHCGTLDPLASGVMIVLFDKATKANQFIVNHNKTYQCTVSLGIMSDTLDIDGNIIEKREFIIPKKADIEEVFNQFIGTSRQEVPLTSAVKVQGKRLYQYQLENKKVTLPIRDIVVNYLNLDNIYDDGFSFTCQVSSGTYIRALARDILKKLNLIGAVKELKRLAVDDISIDLCDDLNEIEQGNYHLHNLSEVIKLPKIEVNNIVDIKNGKIQKLECDEECVLLVNNNEPLAVYKKEGAYFKCLRGLW